jgi:hypothetical protein
MRPCLPVEHQLHLGESWNLVETNLVVTSLRRLTTLAMNEPLIRTIQIVAWAFFVIIVYATLTHVAFVYSIYHALGPWLLRPEIKAYARLEHVTAFAVLGAIFFVGISRTRVSCLLPGV